MLNTIRFLLLFTPAIAIITAALYISACRSRTVIIAATEVLGWYFLSPIICVFPPSPPTFSESLISDFWLSGLPLGCAVFYMTAIEIALTKTYRWSISTTSESSREVERKVPSSPYVTVSLLASSTALLLPLGYLCSTGPYMGPDAVADRVFVAVTFLFYCVFALPCILIANIAGCRIVVRSMQLAAFRSFVITVITASAGWAATAFWIRHRQPRREGRRDYRDESCQRHEEAGWVCSRHLLQGRRDQGSS